jgi:putative transposase
MHYRRAKEKGGTYFFTVNLADRQSDLLINHIEDFQEVLKKVKLRHPFHIDAMVVLPDHLHTIWTLPKEDSDYAKRWMLIKSGFSRNIPKLEFRRKSRIVKGERGIWQRRYWEHMIRDERDYEQHINYIHWPLLRVLRSRHLCIPAHLNPVKHGYVLKAVEWKHSSIHHYIKEEIIDSNRGISETFKGDNFCERA